MADLVHDVLHVPLVGDERDRDVCASQGVRRGVRQRRQALLGELFGRELCGFANDLLDPPVLHLIAVQVRYEVVIRSCRRACAAKPVEVLGDCLDEIGADLYLADAGLGLGVGDPEARAARVVQTDVPDLDVAQLARAGPCVAEDLDHDSSPDVSPPDLQADLCEVVADGGLGEPQLCCDLLGGPALGVQVRYPRNREALVYRCYGLAKGDVLLGGRVDQRGQLVHLEERSLGLGDVDTHALPARGVVVDVAVLDCVVEDRGELVDHLADRARRQRHNGLLVLVAQLGARLDRLTQFARLLELVGLEREA